MASSEKQDCSFSESSNRNFFAALNEMRETGFNTDVVLKSKNEEFPAHQLVLSAKSSYFKNMFGSKFQESLTKTVDFDYIEDEILRTILDYIYMPSVSIIIKKNFHMDQLLEMHGLSRMFELKQLSERCWDLIAKGLTKENCLTVLQVIALHDNPENIHTVVDFIYTNLKELVQTENFENLNESLMKTLLLKFNERYLLMENFFLEAIVKWAKANTDRINFFTESFFCLNFELISRECIDRLLENEALLFENKSLKWFVEFQLRPRSKSENEINTQVNRIDIVFNLSSKLPTLRFFYIGLYSKNASEMPKPALKILTVKNSICTEKLVTLPFLLWKGLAFAQYESEFYFVGGIFEKQTMSYKSYDFFHFDFENNTITWKPSMKEGVAYPRVYVVHDRIYVIGGSCGNKNSPLTIQYYVISQQQWNLITLERNSEFKLLGCVNVKDVLYLLCEKTQSPLVYWVYKIVDTCNFHSLIPLYTQYAFESTLITEYSGNILIFFCYENQWFCLTHNPENKTSQNFPIEAPSSVKFLFCKNMKKSGIIFYSDQHELYQFNYEKRKMIKLMKLPITQKDEEYFEITKSRITCEMMLISDL